MDGAGPAQLAAQAAKQLREAAKPMAHEWTSEQCYRWASKAWDGDKRIAYTTYSKMCLEHEIDGQTLLLLTEEQLRKFGVSSQEHLDVLVENVRTLRGQSVAKAMERLGPKTKLLVKRKEGLGALCQQLQLIAGGVSGACGAIRADITSQFSELRLALDAKEQMFLAQVTEEEQNLSKQAGDDYSTYSQTLHEMEDATDLLIAQMSEKSQSKFIHGLAPLIERLDELLQTRLQCEPGESLPLTARLTATVDPFDYDLAAVTKRVRVMADVFLHCDTSLIAAALQRIEFTDKRVPTIPELSVGAIDTPRSLTASWSPSYAQHPSFPVLGYVLEMARGDQDEMFQEIYRGDKMAHKEIGLEKGTVYCFRLKAQARNGYSGFSAIVQQSTWKI